ncbi:MULTISPECIES: succinyldiaminopimelate transaminase [Thiorhodovibrio]|uniref:succinyldiaminopimelate transaminase n=1 Tax=Thiorhodovibrio TaxID=61593 RepID=UPI001911C3FE|nr:MULTISPECIES: succinyldiaminopimelate transaminase [Thiorhodovibrio]MBK5968431.1 succinyldiaminopimelate transaminase [Thiorhodovibrio winogradskyi]
MNPVLDLLKPYPFERLAALKQGVTPPAELKPIMLSIGEPKHPTPSIIRNALIAHLHHLATYPSTRGLPELRETIAGWLTLRFQLGRSNKGAVSGSGIDPATQILPVNGTREALFALAQALIDPSEQPLVMMPNPFYQIYEGAALLARAEPRYLPCTADNGFLPDIEAVDDSSWKRCQLLYLCSPGNPSGAVMDQANLQRLIELAQRHDFIIAADECYSEIYPDESKPPVGLLQAAAAMGLDDYRRCLVFHSLSKRSNAPGLRSGFVAGDARLIEQFFAYRTYHGCAMPLQHQHASIAAWSDEAHVRENRAQYREKFKTVLEILNGVLDCRQPDGGFYLWARTPEQDETRFARELFASQHLTLLPGRFLSRPDGSRPNGAKGDDPGRGYVRIALVPELKDCIEAAERIRRYCAAL